MDLVTRGFPLWALLAVGIAYAFPAPLQSWKAAIVPLLGLVMLGMGLTLTFAAFAAVLRRPGIIGLGLALQFGIMPLAGWAIGVGLGLPSELLVGMVLVGASPGGTASNLICYLSRGDVALSISLTTASTLAAVVMTPLLTWLYVGQGVPVPALEMLVSIGQIILAPVLAGVLINRYLGHWLTPVKRWFPAISVAAILVIIAIIVALNRDRLVDVGAVLLVAVALHNGCGLLGGYWLARLFGCDAVRARTVAIEVGMQNSGLAVALATQYFTAGAALPGALFSIWHNLSGAALASWWSRR